MIINNNPLLNLLSKSFGASQRNAAFSRDASAGTSIEQTMRDMSGEIGNSLNAYDVARETVDLNSIWQRGRDWGMNPQMDMAIESRNIALKASNEATVSDRERAIMNMEIQGNQKETTRIGLSNEVHGHPTLAEFGVVEEKTKKIEEVETPVYGNPEQPQKPQLDVVWVMDYSGSMGQYFDSLKQAAPEMFKQLEAKGYDVRMGVAGFEANLDQIPTGKLQGSAEAFANDVGSVNIWGGTENGLNALQNSVDTFKSEFRADSTKVTILITDEPSNETGYNFVFSPGGGTSQNPDEISTEPGADQLRQKTADALKSVGSELYAVGAGYNTSMPDADYQDVVNKVGKGTSISLDNAGNWVGEITKNFITSVENDQKAKQTGTKKEYVETEVITKTYKLKDEWDLRFQVGPGAADQITERFKTMTAETSGLIKADVSTAEKAREAIGHASGAIDFINNAKTQIGSLQTRFSSIANTLASSSINKQQNSIFPSAINTYKNTDVLASLAQSYRDRGATIY